MRFFFFFSFHFGIGIFLFCVILEVSKSMNMQSFQSCWQKWSDLMIGYRFYRTNSHFGFCTPTQMMIPKHFHYPNQSDFHYQTVLDKKSEYIPYWIKNGQRNSMEYFVSKTQHFDQYDGDINDEIPGRIKCSLCKSSTPQRSTSSQFNESVYVTAESYDKTDDVSDISMIIPSNDDDTSIEEMSFEERSIDENADHRANRYIVRIVARSK